MYNPKNKKMEMQRRRKISEKLTAHHIKSFAEFAELRFEVSNGITYCKEFHFSKMHTKLIMRSRI